MATIRKLLGVSYNEQTFPDYLKKYGWAFENNNLGVITISRLEQKYDSAKFRQDFEFVNRMTVKLENIAKSNLAIKPTESSNINI